MFYFFLALPTRVQEMKEFRPKKVFSRRREILQTVTSLGFPIESSNTAPGVTLVTSETVEAILTDRRKWDLVHPFKMAVLKNYSQEAARLMAMGLYDKALPIALDAVKKGQAMFKPGPSFQMFPLFLLAAQANLGLKQADQCENFLGLASWLAVKETQDTTNIMRAQLSRLYGQLYALQGKHSQALQSFAEDVYYCSLEYGTQDVRTSLGFYNLGKVFQSKGEMEKCGRCCEQVLDIWLNALTDTVLGEGGPDDGGRMPISEAQLAEVIEMLHDILDIFTRHTDQSQPPRRASQGNQRRWRTITSHWPSWVFRICPCSGLVDGLFSGRWSCKLGLLLAATLAVENHLWISFSRTL